MTSERFLKYASDFFVTIILIFWTYESYTETILWIKLFFTAMCVIWFLHVYIRIYKHFHTKSTTKEEK